MALGTSKMLPPAEFWADRIQRTLLNSKDLLISYGKALEKLEGSTKQTIKEILMVIKDDAPDLYLDKANSLLERLS
ncbi:hypothetical protein [Paenibacillus terrae]|uniref:hypothetical protein n=1 Tax=Paenibacillus terrae TaxID=159743 RepID=UPI000A695B85|nr:hypothetical protein [Paenibacillus terrae]